MDNVVALFKEPKFMINGALIKVLDKDISLIEFLIIVYFDNKPNTSFDTLEIAKTFNLSENQVLAAFNKLVLKNYISVSSSNDNTGRINEVINLDNLYKKTNDILNKEVEETKSSDIYSKFEEEFGRSLSPTEYEIINGWLKTGTTEEMILGALKEAVYNGVRNLRYIDKIIYEWGKKGFKSMEDVDRHLHEKDDDKKIEELFDYNWLEDDE